MVVPSSTGVARQALQIGALGLVLGGLGLVFQRDTSWRLFRLIPVSGVALFSFLLVMGFFLVGRGVWLRSRGTTDHLRIEAKGLILPGGGGLVPWERIESVVLSNALGVRNLRLRLTDGSTRAVGELYLSADPVAVAGFIEAIHRSADRAATLRRPPPGLG